MEPAALRCVPTLSLCPHSHTHPNLGAPPPWAARPSLRCRRARTRGRRRARRAGGRPRPGRRPGGWPRGKPWKRGCLCFVCAMHRPTSFFFFVCALAAAGELASPRSSSSLHTRRSRGRPAPLPSPQLHTHTHTHTHTASMPPRQSTIDAFAPAVRRAGRRATDAKKDAPLVVVSWRDKGADWARDGVCAPPPLLAGQAGRRGREA